jgi:hypothetical protein
MSQRALLLKTLCLATQKEIDLELLQKFVKKVPIKTLIAEAQYQRVALLLRRALKKLGKEDELLDQIAKDTLAKSLLLRRELKKVAKIFKEKSFLYILLKGIYLAEKIYGDLSLRPIGDIDILILKKDRERARKVIKALDYQEQVYGVFLNKECPSLRIELSWEFPFRGDAFLPEVFKRASPKNWNGNQLFVLAPEDLILYQILHLSKHGFSRLIWLGDIVWSLEYYREELDWKCLYFRAREYKMSRLLKFTFELVEELFAPSWKKKPFFLKKGKKKNVPLYFFHPSYEQINSYLLPLLLGDSLSEFIKLITKWLFIPERNLEGNFHLPRFLRPPLLLLSSKNKVKSKN